VDQIDFLKEQIGLGTELEKILRHQKGQMKRIKYSVFIGFTSLCGTAFLGGCSHLPLLEPKGPIGDSERFVIIAAFVLMLIVVVPVFILAYWFSWKYRASNTKATYRPKWRYSTGIDLGMWLVPLAIVAALGILSWKTTHSLDPYKPIDSTVKPISIEVVSLDWKWLFIYPEQDIAVVNQLVFPANVPLSFRVTSDTVITSFFIPQLGSQIYAMPGRQARLHLLADEPGTYTGQNQQFSGRGYADMHFQAIALSGDQFEAWVQKTKQSPHKLNKARYEELERPSSGYPVTYFSSVKPGLFGDIVRKYMPTGANRGTVGENSSFTPVKTGSLKGS
jgi:cytochrome o ubiquinol oxidase subunit 2